MEQQINEIEINGVKYLRADAIATPKPNGKRTVVIVDRGWIFAGDVTEADGRMPKAGGMLIVDPFLAAPAMGPK